MIRTKRVMTDPTAHIENRRIELDRMREKLISVQESRIAAGKQRYVRLAASLDAMSPLRVLARGYAIASDSEGKTVKSVKHLSIGDRMHVRFHDGQAQCLVEKTIEN